MSGIGNNFSIPLASSVAGTQQAKPNSNEAKVQASGQDFQNTLDKLSNKLAGDVDEAELSADRDADGRALPNDAPPEEEESANPPEETAESSPQAADHHKSVDADGILGNIVDLDA